MTNVCFHSYLLIRKSDDKEMSNDWWRRSDNDEVIVLTRFSWFVLVLNKINIDNFILMTWIHGIIAKLAWFHCLYHCWPIADHVQDEQHGLQLNRSVSNSLPTCTCTSCIVLLSTEKSLKYFLLSLFQQFHWTDLGLSLNRINFYDPKSLHSLVPIK